MTRWINFCGAALVIASLVFGVWDFVCLKTWGTLTTAIGILLAASSVTPFVLKKQDADFDRQQTMNIAPTSALSIGLPCVGNVFKSAKNPLLSRQFTR